jgi:siderophore synthetase component
MSSALIDRPARQRSASQTQSIGDRAACHALLNCLIKEFALPMSLVSYERVDPASWSLIIAMPDGTQFWVLVDRQDCFGSQYYLSEVFGRRADESWHPLELHDFARYLVESCSAIMRSRNAELLPQILASRDLKQLIADHVVGRDIDPLANYLRSEQCLWFGHPTHPAPKARMWPQRHQQEQYAPEFGRALRLHLLEVPEEGLWMDANGLSRQQVLAGVANQTLARRGHAILSLHPIQADLFLQDPRVQKLLKERRIKDLGRTGFTAYPTASLRTLYVEGHDYFIKGSLNVRITNCVRKNAWYELESAVIVDRVLDNLKAATGGLHYVAEPAAVSWSPPELSGEDRLWFKEQTGTILRRNFCLTLEKAQTLLAGTLFGRDSELAPNIQRFVAQDELLPWFRRYQALLLRPVLSMFFNHGVVFEPHLQNTVVVHEQRQPCKLLLRDYEGVKLLREISEQIDERVKRSLQYTRAQGWSRIAYCLFVNNLSEAVLALTQRQPRLAAQMWQLVRHELQEIRRELLAPAPELDELIAGGPVPCKTNFKVRLAAAADKHAGYVQLRSPWAP